MNCIGQTSWKTKEDMLQDLSAIGQTRINDDFLVIGQRPPPPLRDDVDDEIDLRFGGTSYDSGHSSVKPDLNGIQQCLRMVHGSDDEDRDTPYDGTIVISKLNPLVKEFVPKKIQDAKSPPKLPSPRASVEGVGNKSASITSPENVVGGLESRTENCVTTTEISEKSDKGVTENSIPKDVAKKTNELRNKISATFKSDSPIHKKERNAAISNLLKLHSAKPTTDDKKIKLFTPDYFTKGTKDTEHPPTVEKMEITETVETENENDEINVDIDKKTIQESIEKVNNWLEPKSPQVVKSATSMVCIGPISFKRKGMSVKSPNGSAVDTKVHKINPTAQFKPSKYADDLAKQYMARSEAKERQETSKCQWDNLEEVLKKKDEEIRNKKVASSRQ